MDDPGFIPKALVNCWLRCDLDGEIVFFIKGIIPDGPNETNVVLIPKKKCTTKMTELRTISLCNVFVKIIAKVIANRMKGMLESVISKNQSAIISGRLISNNIMISYEVMHYLKMKRRGKHG